MGFFFLSNPFTVMVFSYPISSCSCSSYYLWVLKKAKLLDDMKHVGALVLLEESVYPIILLGQFLMNSRRSISLDSWLRRKLCCPHSLRNLNSTWWYCCLLERAAYLFSFSFWWSVLQYGFGCLAPVSWCCWSLWGLCFFYLSLRYFSCMAFVFVS